MAGVLYLQDVLPWGGSWAIIIPKDLRENLQLRQGDQLIMRLHGPYVTFRRAIPDMLLPLDKVRLEDMPPRWPGAKEDARPTDHPKGKAATPAKPDAGKDG